MRCEWCGATQELRWAWGMRRDRTHGFRLVCLRPDWRCWRDGMQEPHFPRLRPVADPWVDMDYRVYSDKERD